MFFTCFHLTHSGVGMFRTDMPQGKPMSSFSSFSSVQNKVLPLPGLSQSSRFSTEMKVASNGLAHFQLLSPRPSSPFAFCLLCLMLAQESKSPGAVLANSAVVFSRDEASMEWSGVEL